MAADMGEPDPWAFQQHSMCATDIPGTRGSSLPPSLHPPQLVSSWLSCLSFPLKHQKEETSYRLRASSTFYRCDIYLSPFFSSNLGNNRFCDIAAAFLVPHRSSSFQLTARHDWGFWVSYQSGVLSYAWCCTWPHMPRILMRWLKILEKLRCHSHALLM